MIKSCYFVFLLSWMSFLSSGCSEYQNWPDPAGGYNMTPANYEPAPMPNATIVKIPDVELANMPDKKFVLDKQWSTFKPNQEIALEGMVKGDRKFYEVVAFGLSCTRTYKKTRQSIGGRDLLIDMEKDEIPYRLEYKTPSKPGIYTLYLTIVLPNQQENQQKVVLKHEFEIKS